MRIFKILAISFSLLMCFPVISYGAALLVDNPADLAYAAPQIELQFPALALSAGNNLFKFDDLNIDLTTPAQKTAFLNRLNNGVLSGTFATSLETGVTVGPLKIAFKPWASGTVHLTPGVPELFFNDYIPDHNYQINGSTVSGLAAVSLDLSYGYKFIEQKSASLGAGLTLHYFQVGELYQAQIVNSALSTDSWGQTQYDLTVVSLENQNPGFQSLGQGVAVDLGVVYQDSPWKAGLVLKNIGPGISCSGLAQKTSNYTGSISGGPNGPEFPADASSTSNQATVNSTIYIPVTASAYGSYQLDPEFSIPFGIDQGFGDGWGVVTSPKLWAGITWESGKQFQTTGLIQWQDNQFSFNTYSQLNLGSFSIKLNLGVSNISLSQTTEFNGSLAFLLDF